MLYLASRMARHRIAALLAIACATLGGAAFLTVIGVLAESGFRSHSPVDRLTRADIVVSAGQTLEPAGDLPIALPERARVPGDVVGRLARLPGVTAAIGDLSFPAAVVDGRGGVVPAGDPRAAGHGWSSTALLDHPHVAGTAPAGPLEVAVDDDTAAAAGVARRVLRPLPDPDHKQPPVRQALGINAVASRRLLPSNPRAIGSPGSSMSSGYASNAQRSG
jgi:putative ABC transport system permease protein